MNINIEFIGISRILTGTSHYSCKVPENSTFHEIVKLIAKKYPKLVGQVIRPDGLDLFPSNLFSVNGSKMIKPGDMDQKPVDGDRLILMSILAGG